MQEYGEGMRGDLRKAEAIRRNLESLRERERAERLERELVEARRP